VGFAPTGRLTEFHEVPLLQFHRPSLAWSHLRTRVM
jgi:hypothetical protein